MGMSVTISAATERDAEQILKLQFLCYQSEAALYGDYSIEPLTQPLDSLKAELAGGTVLVARLGDEVVASVRGAVDADGTARIDKLIVHPRMQRHGLGGRLLDAIEARLTADAGAKSFRLFTGHRSERNLRLYRKHGYEPVGTERVDERLSLVTLAKRVGAGAFVTSA
ncbi:ribosomal protein S18 acetylase RimI-like enzyme [Streptomyces sp. V3I8]|jgi:ribosomal protein S18 acetylase RimI-like enzyme|uniref:GNAT family N-acetyltransferase n=1 Tax=Streptomyces sp. V3I8 TaxID=3042279 RepID=UPI0027893BB6|nr:GNAT family N-acetyltransferase [Streptomyces sp. V3I8]MDQ1039876.1 ribosomal protein S18 acetylase RimI-like enzyme [Streptomyces sp. V3I8]